MPKLRAYRPPSSLRLLEHVLENPALVSAVRELPPAALGRLLDHVGLEDAAELVGLATTSQLEGVFDEDLWRAKAAGDEPRFDPARFGLWLEVLLEAGEKVVVERLCELPLEFVILGVSRLVLVVDMDELGRELGDDEEAHELTDNALDSAQGEEWEEFRLISRDPMTWDAVLAALLALDRDHHDLLRRILERVAATSSEYIADNGGLYDVLTSDEMLESDARAGRDDRRAARGYVAASDARGFLALARQGLDESAERDPVTRAYFRELERTPAASPKPTRGRAPKKAAMKRLTRLLDEATASATTALPTRELTSERALVTTEQGSLLGVALARLGEEAPLVQAERAEELAYLTNVIVAGDATGDGRSFRPVEALERALLLANVGLEHELDRAHGTGPHGARETADERAERAFRLLETTHLDRLFRLGLRRREA